MKQFLNNTDGAVFVTKSTADKKDAIEAKMRLVEPKLAGIKMIRYERGDMRRVWVPNCFLLFDFEVNRNVFFNQSKTFTKTGQVGAVFDLNELHTSHYDIAGDGELEMQKMQLNQLSGQLLEDGCSQEEMLEQAERSIQRQILWKAYKMEGTLKLVKAVKFYREAFELQLYFKGNEFLKYAYLDQYGTQNERVRGLKVRLGD